eukprot:jgi/Hompol1/3653/HPOL_006665-RA
MTAGFVCIRSIQTVCLLLLFAGYAAAQSSPLVASNGTLISNGLAAQAASAVGQDPASGSQPPQCAGGLVYGVPSPPASLGHYAQLAQGDTFLQTFVAPTTGVLCHVRIHGTEVGPGASLMLSVFGHGIPQVAILRGTASFNTSAIDIGSPSTGDLVDFVFCPASDGIPPAIVSQQAFSLFFRLVGSKQASMQILLGDINSK